MKKLSSLFKDSASELRNLSTLVLTALFIALAAVLGMYTIQISNTIKITFTFIAIALTGYTFGPVVGGLMGGMTDIVAYLVKPTGAYFPGFTLGAILTGMIYGLILYKRPISLTRAFFAKATVSFTINLFLSTLWVTIISGMPYLPLLGTRFIKQIIMLPIEVALLFMIIKSLEKANVFTRLVRNND